MKKDKDTIINCHYRNDANKIDFFCDINYRDGVDFVLTVHSKDRIKLVDNSFTCYDGENRRYILSDLTYQEDEERQFFDKRYFFNSLIIINEGVCFGQPKTNTNSIKFKSIYFTFREINSFFFDIDYVKPTGFDSDDKGLIYQKNNKFIPFDFLGFKISLMSGYSYGGGSIGGNGGHFDLIKSIKVSSEEETELKYFIDAINSLTKFFSICLKKRVLITDIWSNREDNTSLCNATIKTFQFYIINKEYDEKSPRALKNLATHALLKDNLGDIVNQFHKLHSGDYHGFPVFCDLYLRYLDAPVEILNQMLFLPLMQGIEAYVSKKSYNKNYKIPKESSKALKKFKENNPTLAMINSLKFDNYRPFQEKINNVIKEHKIEDIIIFKLNKQKNFKLIDQMVKIRNLYTHYGDLPNIPDQDFYDAMDYAEIICEIFIMKELKFTDTQIRSSLANRYYYLAQLDNKYCSLNNIHNVPEGFKDKFYIGEKDCFSNKKYKKYALFYSKLDDGRIELLAKNMMKYGKTRKKIIKKQLKDSEYNKLDVVFKKCYDNYIETEEQLKLRDGMQCPVTIQQD